MALPRMCRLSPMHMLLVVGSAALQGCFVGGGFFSKDSSRSASGSGGESILTSTIEESGAESAILSDPGATQVFEPTAPDLAGTIAITFPPNTLPAGESVTVQTAVDIASDATLSDLGAGESQAVVSTGGAVVISSSSSVEAAEPFAIALSLPEGSSLLDGTSGHRNLVVFYKVRKSTESDERSLGIIPRSSIEVTETRAIFKTKYFGAFQLAVLAQEMTEAPVEVKTSVPILTRHEAASLPPITWSLGSPEVNGADATVSFAVTGLETISSCVAILDLDRQAPWDGSLQLGTDARVTVSRKRDESHEIYVRFECRDVRGRMSGPSDWVGIAFEAKVAATPTPTPTPTPANVVPSITGAPSGTVRSTTVNITIGGSGVSHYSFKYSSSGSSACAMSSGYSTYIAVATPITDNTSSLANSTITLCVLGRDSSGNETALGSAASTSWIHDSTGPSDPSSPTATAGNGSVALSWNAVSGASSYLLVARAGSAVTWSPSDGASYTNGESLDANHGVAYVGAGTSSTVTGLTNFTTYYYKLFAMDNVYNYSGGSAASATPKPAGMFTYLSGDNSANPAGNYGTQGTASVANIPKGRMNSAMTSDGTNFLVFGGEFAGGSMGNDMWRFDGTYWTWMRGSSSTNGFGVYGSAGSASATNTPGARYDAKMVHDGSNAWLFGGHGYDAGPSTPAGGLADLWRFDGTNWAYIKGSQSASGSATFGSSGVEAGANTPGGRRAGCMWSYGTHLYVFGGYYHYGSGNINDMWRYSKTTGDWAWIHGSNSVGNTGTTGTRLAESTAPTPGARFLLGCASGGGYFWAFGGSKNGATQRYNDLWRFNPVTGYWTWISGSSSHDQAGTYGTKGVAGASNVPGARESPVLAYDPAGYIWVYGGYGYDGSSGSGYLNDLWKYSIADDKWTWVAGNSTATTSTDLTMVHGTAGSASSTVYPGYRRLAPALSDSYNIYFMGGQDSLGSTRGELWRYTFE